MTWLFYRYLQGVNTVNVCIPTAASASDLTLCNNALALANTEQVSFACVSGGSEDGCMVKIRDGSADLTTLGASGLLPAYEDYDLFPLLAEVYGESKSPTEYYSVAVVNQEFCGTNIPTLQSLKGANMCSTGYRKTAGWIAPIGMMIESGVMEIVSDDPTVKSDAQSVSNFFGNVCAPRTTADGPRTDGTLFSPLCSGCQDDCSIDDKYYSYDGSFRCLMEGNGDVAFTKDDIVSTLALDGSDPAQWATKNKVSAEQ
jgi:melanoma-associated antigen p97